MSERTAMPLTIRPKCATIPNGKFHHPLSGRNDMAKKKPSKLTGRKDKADPHTATLESPDYKGRVMRQFQLGQLDHSRLSDIKELTGLERSADAIRLVVRLVSKWKSRRLPGDAIESKPLLPQFPVRFFVRDSEAVEAIRVRYHLATPSEAVRLAIAIAARRLQD